MFKKNNIIFFLCVWFIIMLVLNSVGFAATNEPKYGGTLRFAMTDNPSSLDQMVVTSDPDTIISQHMFEGLYTYNSKYEPLPMLAESSEIKDDGKLVTIHLRKGVLFHNGEEMTSGDVLASLNRWGEFGVRGPVMFKHVEKVEAVDKYTVNIYFKSVFGSWKTMLAFINGGPVIQPKEIMETAGPEPIKPEQFIGTGPYKLKEWAQGRYVALERFDDYCSRDEEPDGYAGRRVAYIDNLIFYPVSDSVTRKDGVRVGDYDWGYNIPGDFYNELKEDPSVNTVLIGAPSFGEVFFNSKKGIFKDNPKLREAVAAALDHEAIMRAAVGQEGLYVLNGSIYPVGTVYYSEKGIEKYNRNDSALARQLAKEAGYNGEKIRLMISSTHPVHYNSCTVMVPMLLAAGFNIDFQLYDWATLLTRRSDPDLWDIFYTGHGFVPDPTLFTFISPTYPGWWVTEERNKLVEKLDKISDIGERAKVWGEIQALIYEQYPIIKTGDIYTFDIASPKLKGITGTSLIWPSFWNTWFEE